MTKGRTKGQVLGLCWGSVPGAGLLDMARLASTNGMTALSIRPDQLGQPFPPEAKLAHIRARLPELGVRVAVVDPLIKVLPGIPAASKVDPPLRALLEFTPEDCWRAGEAVGAGAINLTHFLGEQVELARMEDEVAMLAEQNHVRGFATTFEFIPGTGVPDLVTAAKVTSASPHARIMFDTWHFARSGGKLEDIDALPPESIGGVQINDWLPPEPGAVYVPMSGRLMPGEGCLLLAEILARIEANSPGLAVCVEVFSAEITALGWEEAVRRMAAMSRPFLAGSTERE